MNNHEIGICPQKAVTDTHTSLQPIFSLVNNSNADPVIGYLYHSTA
jgi:hypothetical protein